MWRYKLTDIEWDIDDLDGDDFDENGEEFDLSALPNEYVLTSKKHPKRLDTTWAVDQLTEIFGFCINNHEGEWEEVL